MRNAILLPTRAFGGQNHATIWKVFANRGMGFFAGASAATTPAPAPTSTPRPANHDKGTIHGDGHGRRLG